MPPWINFSIYAQKYLLGIHVKIFDRRLRDDGILIGLKKAFDAIYHGK